MKIEEPNSLLSSSFRLLPSSFRLQKKAPLAMNQRGVGMRLWL